MKKLKNISFFGKGIGYYSIFIPVFLLLYACPFSSSYKLDKDPTVPVDEVLMGKWATMISDKNGSLQPVKMILGKSNDTEYNIAFIGEFYDLQPYKVILNDTIKGTAYLSIVTDRQFLNIEINGQTYISVITYKNDTLSLLVLADGFTAKYIKSDVELRNAVEVHIRTRLKPHFDEQFSLKEMVRVN